MEPAMRSLILITALATLSIVDVRPGQATEGPWCLHSRDQDMNCSIPSQQQCIFVALPVNGQCWPNPNYRGNVRETSRSKARTRKHSAY
jgi:Protein of unknown function (DUF3551)